MVLAGTVTATGIIPLVGIGLILGIHRFMGEGMAVTNTIGNAVAAIAIGRWTGRLDEQQMSAALAANRPVRVSDVSTGPVAGAPQALGPEP